MRDYLLFESRDPFESVEVAHHQALAAGLAREGRRVALFLVQNGVLAARRTTRARDLTPLVQAGVELLADDFSLRERGMEGALLAPGVRKATIEDALDLMEQGRNALWF